VSDLKPRTMQGQWNTRDAAARSLWRLIGSWVDSRAQQSVYTVTEGSAADAVQVRVRRANGEQFSRRFAIRLHEREAQ